MSNNVEKIAMLDSGTNYTCGAKGCDKMSSNSLYSARRHRESTGHVIYITAWFNKILASEDEIESERLRYED